MPKWMDSAREFLGLGEDPYYDDDYDALVFATWFGRVMSIFMT